MPRNRKPELYNLLKSHGALTKTYVQYTLDDLERELAAAGIEIPKPVVDPAPKPKEPEVDMDALKEAYNATVTEPPQPEPPRQAAADPDEMPAQRLNTQTDDEIIRIDEQGRAWYQEEVRKPAYPKPRGRRVLTYIERGVQKETVQNGEYLETFEVAGQGPGRPAEVKITLPSYQVGIYKDPRFPFRIHCYNEREGFDFYEVNDFYGGSELVPEMCKRIYIENELCYDIRSVIRAIQAEHRQLQLAGRL